MPDIRLALAIMLLFASASAAVGGPVYPNCILDGLKNQTNAQYPVILNVTKMCLTSEQVPLPVDAVNSLRAKAKAALDRDRFSQSQFLAVTLDNDTTYILTEVTVRLWNDGLDSTSVSNGFTPVYRGPGTMGPSPDVVFDRTILPLDTREFPVSAPQIEFVKMPAWDIVSAKGIPSE